MNRIFHEDCRVVDGGCPVEPTSPDVIVLRTEQGAQYRTSYVNVESISSLVRQSVGDLIVEVSLCGACRAWFRLSDEVNAVLEKEAPSCLGPTSGYCRRIT